MPIAQRIHPASPKRLKEEEEKKKKKKKKKNCGWPKCEALKKQHQ
jgi:hypothetical protein